MAIQITNQAFLTYNYGNTIEKTSSNIAAATMLEPLAVDKSSLGDSYRRDCEITYILSMGNQSNTDFTDLTITDDLGSYTTIDGVTVTPLSYTGPAVLYIDGEINPGLTVTDQKNQAVFVMNSLPSRSNAIIIYKARVNGFAPLDVGAQIENTSEWSAMGLPDGLSDSDTVTVAEYADVDIIKTMSPDTVTNGNVVTYMFTLYNYGNTEATNVVLNDRFDPAPESIAVSINGEDVPQDDYSYADAGLTLPSAAAIRTMTIPPAGFTQDSATGESTVNPGVTVIVVKGTL